MGEKKPSTRTLDDGTKVTHYPDGTQVMHPFNTLLEKIDAEMEANEAANEELTDKRLAAVEEKRDKQLAGDAVPTDKTPL